MEDRRPIAPDSVDASRGGRSGVNHMTNHTDTKGRGSGLREAPECLGHYSGVDLV
jgi:hypothetical protein